MVTNSPSKTARGGGASRQPLVRYGETFEKLCGQYMAWGMSYHEYWDGDCLMVKYYREVATYKLERENYLAWLQGLYIYSALNNVASIFNPLSKKKKANPYMEMPIPITERAKDDENHKKMENGKNIMQLMAKGLNAKFRKGGADDGR